MTNERVRLVMGDRVRVHQRIGHTTKCEGEIGEVIGERQIDPELRLLRVKLGKPGAYRTFLINEDNLSKLSGRQPKD